ncbi:MAG: hypothetical protein IJO32_06995 [Bacilli bacterium]|nr:hypothetical protein [Bacilli bacterium]
MEKKNTGLIVLVVVLSIAVLGLSGFIVYDKILSNEEEIITKNDNENSDESNKNITFNHTTLSVDYLCNFELDKICELKHDKILIKLENTSDNEYPIFDIKINDKLVLSEVIYLNDEINIIDNNVIISHSGTDINSSHIYIFDNKGNNTLSLFSGFDTKYPAISLKSEYLENGNSIDYKIIGNKIIIEGTRLSHGPSIVISEKEYIELYNNNCLQYENEVVYGKYEIEYLGNNKFSETKNVGYTLLKDIGYYSQCK